MGKVVRAGTVVLAFICTGLVASGQSVTMSIGSGSSAAGGTVTLPITLASSGGAQPLGFQWSFSYSADVLSVSVTGAGSTSSAQKSISCSGNMCIVYGMNSTVIADGTVGSATFQLAANPASPTIPIQITNVIAVDAAANSIPASGGSGAIIVNIAPTPSVTLSGLNCTSTTLAAAGTTPCTASLSSAAGSSGFTIPLSSSNTNVTVPASVLVAAGKTSAQFTATAAQVTADQPAVLSASTGGVTKTVGLSLVAPVQLTSVSCLPSTLGSNASGTCTASLNKTTPGTAVVSLNSSNSGLVTVPGTVTVPAGQSSATFSATVGTVSTGQNVTITGTLNGQAKSATLNLTVSVQPSTLTCTSTAINTPGTASCTVTLSAAAPSGGASVALLSNNPALTVPASVTVAAGQTTATFTATAAKVTSNQTGQLTATLNGGSKSLTLSINFVNSTQVSSLVCTSAAINSPGTTNCTVTLSAPAPAGGITIALLSNNPAVTVPANVTVAAGQTSTTFPATAVTTASLTSTVGAGTTASTALLTATLNGASKSFTLSVTNIVAPQLVSLSCASAAINAPGSTTCTVTLSASAPSAGTSVALSSANPAVKVPTNVTVTSGKTTGTFTATVSTVSTDQTANLIATLNGVSQSFTISIGVPAQLTSLSCLTTTLAGNAASNCTVTLNKPALSPAVVTLTRSTGAVTVPVNTTIPTGQTSATFQAKTTIVNMSQVTVWAAYNGVTKSTILTLTTIQLSAMNCSLTKVSGGWTSSCTLTLTARAPSGGSTVALSSSSNVIGVPPTVVVPSGAPGVSFSPVVALQATIPPTVITATLYGASKTATLSGAATTTQSGSSPVTSAARTSKPSNKPGQATHVMGLYNAASYLPEQTCSPGSMATLVGSGFTGSEPQQAAASPWPTQLGGLHVTSNDNVDLPISAVTDTLVQFQCPVLPAGTPVSISVGSSQFAESLQFTMQEATPGVYVLDTSNQGAVLVAGTNQVAMATTEGMPSRPARKGEYLSIYANGLGPLQEDLPLGTPAPLDHTVQTTDQVVVVVGEIELPASFAGLAPGTTGVYQVNVRLTPDVPSGNAVPYYLKVVLSDGTVVKSNIATVAIITTATQDISQ